MVNNFLHFFLAIATDENNFIAKYEQELYHFYLEVNYYFFS
jgi:hypothetical protein